MGRSDPKEAMPRFYACDVCEDGFREPGTKNICYTSTSLNPVYSK